jgi:TolA-binding protein
LEEPAPQAETAEVIPEGIRSAPAPSADEAEATLARANNFYARKLYEFAIPEFEKFLVLKSTGKKRDEAMFRLAESHRLAGNAAASRAGYEKLVTEFQSGEFAAAGAYRLGTILFSERLHEPASLQFGIAAREAKQPEVRLAAGYFAGRSLEALGKDDGAEESYKAVLETKTDNPYFENAAMALGAIQMRLGKSKAAMATYEILAEAAATPEVSANAYLQAARLAKDSGFTPKALGLYDQAAEKAVDTDTKTQARLSALRLRFEAKDHEGVLKTAAELENEVPAAARPEVLQILAASLRRSGRDQEAKEAYDRLIAGHPEEATPEILYQDPSLVDEADRFAQSAADPKQKAAVALLKAESLFQSANHAAAAKAYEPLLENTWLESPQRTAALYKYAWSLAASGDSEGAIRAYTEFLAKYPNDKLASSALLQRGLARQKTKDYEGAIADFDLLLKDYAMGKEVELALLQKALTCGHLKKYPEMAEAFRQLLEKYPKSAAAAQANFWLGWAAYENRDFKESIRYLARARELDDASYGARATLRIVLAHYQLENRDAAAREVERHQGVTLPPEVLVWIAEG